MDPHGVNGREGGVIFTVHEREEMAERTVKVLNISCGHCVKTIDLKNGAIDGCPYGNCIPHVSGDQLNANRNLMGEQQRLQAGFVLQVDVQAPAQPQQLVRKILEHFSN